jgi:hypothetical protein
MPSGFELNDIRSGFAAAFEELIILVKNRSELEPCFG